MAPIRMALSAGAALIALMAIVPAASHAQAPKAPLQLVPEPDRAKKTTSAGTAKAATTKKAAAKKPAATPNGTRAAASKKAPRQNAATAQAISDKKSASNKKSARQTVAAAEPSSNKTARINSKKTANSVASRRQSEPTSNAQRARVASAPRAKRAVAVAQQPILRSPVPEPQIVAQGGNERVTSENIMRGGDSISLIALLPWWRNDRMQDVNYGSEEAESQVIAAADAWFAAHGTEADRAYTTREALALASADDAGTVEIADAGELNDIDLAAASVPAPPEPSFLQSLIALLGGAIAAAAASARLLFV